jgi:hypothetical protein
VPQQEGIIKVQRKLQAVDDLIDIIFYYECIRNENRLIVDCNVSDKLDTSYKFVIEKRLRAYKNNTHYEKGKNNSGNARFHVLHYVMSPPLEHFDLCYLFSE